MNKVNRLDIYLREPNAINEGIKIISTWGNRQGYDKYTPYEHLIQNMNGWVGEEIFRATFKEYDYIDKEDHSYLSESKNPASRQGLPDFVNSITGNTCELKTYWDQKYIDTQINKWKINDNELHNASYVVILNRNKDKKHEFYLLDRDNWTLSIVDKEIEYPIWYNGFMKK